MNRPKTEIVLFSFLLVVTLALTAGAVYEQIHHQNVSTAAVVKAQKERDQANSLSRSYQLQLQSADTQVQAVTAQKVAACADLATHKLADPACVAPKE